MKHPLLVILISLTLLMVNSSPGLATQSTQGANPQVSPTMKPQVEKIKKKIEKSGLGRDITVILNDNREFYGSIKNIEQDNFMMFEVDSRQLLTIKYEEVKKVRDGYGSTRDRSGKRIKPGKALIGSIIAAAAIAIPVIIVLVSLSKER